MIVTKEQAAKGGMKSSRKGIPNKSTKEIRETIQLVVEASAPIVVEKLLTILDDNPEKGVDLWIKLSEFVLPKLQRVEMSGSLTVEKLLALPSEQRKARILELSNKKDSTHE